jgi:hypothetical protein
VIRPPATAAPVPVRPLAVRTAVWSWLLAIAAGAAEALVRLALPEPPTATDLAVRFAIYATLVVLVLVLRTGSNRVRWTLAVLLGGLGTLSLVIEPLSWLLDGGSPTAFLATADGPTLLVIGLRVLHIAAVVAAMVAMFRPGANAFFRRP